MQERATVSGAYLVKRGWRGGFAWAGVRARMRLWGGIGGGGGVGGVGGVVVTEFGVKSLHFLHANVVSCAQLEFVHGGGWVEVDVVGEGAEL